MSKLLTQAELVKLTGYKQRTKQAETLASWGIRFALNARVLSVTWEQVNKTDRNTNDEAELGMNFEALA